jgi:hypothetical protein
VNGNFYRGLVLALTVSLLFWIGVMFLVKELT